MERGREGREGSGGVEAFPEFLEYDGDICESRGSLGLGWRGGGSGSSVVPLDSGRRRA